MFAEMALWGLGLKSLGQLFIRKYELNYTCRYIIGWILFRGLISLWLSCSHSCSKHQI